MGPGTIHVVFSSEPTVVWGGYAYSYFLMEDTVVGLYHTLASFSVATNELKLENHKVLRRMMRALHAVYCQEFKDAPSDLSAPSTLGETDDEFVKYCCSYADRWL